MLGLRTRILEFRWPPPRTLLELCSTCIAKSCGRKVGVERAASALTSLLPRPLLQRVCQEVELSAMDNDWLLAGSRAASLPDYLYVRWYPSEEVAYRAQICNDEVDRYNEMQQQQQQAASPK